MNSGCSFRLPLIFAVLAVIAATAQAAPRAYISRCCDTGSSLILFDSAQELQIARIPFFAHMAGSATISPDGKSLYLLDIVNSSLLAYSIATDQAARVISLGGAGGYPNTFYSNQMIAPAPDGSRAYVALGSSVAVVDLIAGQLITLISFDFPPAAVVLSKDARHLYVPPASYCGRECPQVNVIDTATNTVVAEMDSGVASTSATLTPDGTRLYVAHQQDYLTYYDTATNSYLGQIPITAASDIAIKLDGTELYAAQNGRAAIAVVDLKSNRLVSTIGLTAGAQKVAITPDGSQAYALDAFDGEVSIVHTADDSLETTLTLPQAVDSVAFVPGQNRAFFTDTISSTVGVIGTVSEQATGLLLTPPEPGPLAMSPDHKTLYVAGSNGLAEIDTASGRQLRVIPVPFPIQAIAVDKAGKRALLALFADTDPTTAAVVDLSSGETLATIKNFGVGASAAFSPDGSTGYVGDASQLLVIDMSTYKITKTVDFGPGSSKTVSAILASPDGTRLYVAVDEINTVYIFETSPFRQVGAVAGLAPGDFSIVMALTHDGETLLVPTIGALAFVDLPSQTVTDRVSVAGLPSAVAIAPNGASAWTAAAIHENAVSIIDIALRTVTGTVDAGGSATGIVFAP